MSEQLNCLPAEYYRVGQAVFFHEKVVTLVTVSSVIHCEVTDSLWRRYCPISAIKPILRRLDLMTREERNHIENTHDPKLNFTQNACYYSDWLDANGFDRPRWINGVRIESLIDAGLAVDAAKLETK